MIVAEGLAFDSQTRDWTKPVQTEHRCVADAINWIRFNRDWMKSLRYWIVRTDEEIGNDMLTLFNTTRRAFQ